MRSAQAENLFSPAVRLVLEPFPEDSFMQIESPVNAGKNLLRNA
jgi:hypothetical protein